MRMEITKLKAKEINKKKDWAENRMIRPNQTISLNHYQSRLTNTM